VKLIIVGFALVSGFTALAYVFSLLIRFVNFMIDKSIKKEETKWKERQAQDNKHRQEGIS
jgi:hypothetical protein